MKKSFLYILVSCIIASMSGCLQESAIVETTTDSLSAQQAKEVYEARISEGTTKTSSVCERANMFYRESYIPDWNRALSTRTDYVESVDVPLAEKCDYYVMSNDGQGFYLTCCHHSITVVRSVESKTTGVYHHFFIPFRDSRDLYRESFKGELYRGFHNNGYRDGFSGLEIYANTQGKVIKILRYYNGTLYDKFFDGNGKKESDMIRHSLKYYISKAYGIRKDLRTRDGSQYHCPQCGHELNEYNGYYYCTECGWNEMDFWEQDLDECYIYGDGGGSGIGNEGGSPDPNYPNSPDPDPNTGSGGSNNGSGNGNNNTEQGEIPTSFSFDSNAVLYIIPSLQVILQDCAGQTIINALSQENISFVWNSSLMPQIAVIVSSNLSSISISRVEYNVYGTINIGALFEELYHCLQVISDDYNTDWKLNVEIEAKLASYIYAKHTGKVSNLTIPNGASCEWWNNVFEPYLIDPSESNYARMADSVRASHPMYASMLDNPEHHTMNYLSTIFDCYE